MNQIEDDQALEALLRAGLAPPSREPDAAFVAGVDAAVAEAERYRRWRTRFRRQLTTDLLTFGGIAGAFATLSRAPAVNEMLARTPALAWSIPMLLLLGWLTLNRGAKGRHSLS